MVLSDNGLAYNGSRRGQSVTFEQNLRTLGINPVASTPRHPQTCGKIERFHQTTKKWLKAQTPATSLDQLNNQLVTFTNRYNNKRPHESLNRAIPATIHAAQPKARPANQPTNTPKRITTPKVCVDGTVWSRPWRINIGRQHAGLQVTCIIDGDHAYIFDQDTLLKTLTLKPDTPGLYHVPNK